MEGPNMISANSFARQGSIWTQVTPTIEPAMRWMNSHQESLGRAVDSSGDSQRNALIAEAAFLLAGSEFRYIPGNPGWVEREARNFLIRLPRGQEAEGKITSDEWDEIGRLARVTQYYTRTMKNPTFSARVPGCGVVDQANCDVLGADELVEMKTVTRPFRSLDLRQALTYAAMLYASNRVVSKVTLLNPRRAVNVTLTISEISQMARGDSSGELLQDLVEWMTGLQVSA